MQRYRTAAAAVCLLLLLLLHLYRVMAAARDAAVQIRFDFLPILRRDQFRFQLALAGVVPVRLRDLLVVVIPAHVLLLLEHKDFVLRGEFVIPPSR